MTSRRARFPEQAPWALPWRSSAIASFSPTRRWRCRRRATRRRFAGQPATFERPRGHRGLIPYEGVGRTRRHVTDEGRVDTELVNRAQHGDRAAFGLLAAELAPRAARQIG